MNKIKLFFVVLVIALALTGTAYASWTQQVILESKIETGILSVGVSASSDASVASEWSDDTMDFKPTTTASVNANNVTFVGDNFFPGTVQEAKIILENTGTIPCDIEIRDLYEDMPSYMHYSVHIKTATEDVVYNGSSLNVVSGKSITLDLEEVAEISIIATISGINDEESMKENSTYTYSFLFDVSQFNIDNY